MIDKGISSRLLVESNQNPLKHQSFFNLPPWKRTFSRLKRRHHFKRKSSNHQSFRDVKSSLLQSVQEKSWWVWPSSWVVWSGDPDPGVVKPHPGGIFFKMLWKQPFSGWMLKPWTFITNSEGSSSLGDLSNKKEYPEATNRWTDTKKWWKIIETKPPRSPQMVVKSRGIPSKSLNPG